MDAKLLLKLIKKSLVFLFLTISFTGFSNKILSILTHEDPRVQKRNILALKNYVHEGKKCSRLTFDDLVEPFIKSLNSQNCEVKIEVAELLLETAQYNQRIKDLIRESGGLEFFARWVKIYSGRTRELQLALTAIQNLSYNNHLNQEAFLKLGIIPSLTSIYKRGSLTLQIKSLAALRNLAFQNNNNYEVIISEGNFLENLIFLLKHHPSGNEEAISLDCLISQEPMEFLREQEELESLLKLEEVLINIRRRFNLEIHSNYLSDIFSLVFSDIFHFLRKSSDNKSRGKVVDVFAQFFYETLTNYNIKRRVHIVVFDILYNVINRKGDAKELLNLRDVSLFLTKLLSKTSLEKVYSEKLFLLLNLLLPTNIEYQEIFRENKGFERLLQYMDYYQHDEAMLNQIFIFLMNLLDDSVINRKFFHKSNGSAFLISLLKSREHKQYWLKERILKTLLLLTENNIPRQQDIIKRNQSFLFSFYKKEQSESLKLILKEMISHLKINAFERILAKEVSQ